MVNFHDLAVWRGGVRKRIHQRIREVDVGERSEEGRPPRGIVSAVVAVGMRFIRRSRQHTRIVVPEGVRDLCSVGVHLRVDRGARCRHRRRRCGAHGMAQDPIRTFQENHGHTAVSLNAGRSLTAETSRLQRLRAGGAESVGGRSIRVLPDVLFCQNQADIHGGQCACRLPAQQPVGGRVQIPFQPGAQRHRESHGAFRTDGGLARCFGGGTRLRLRPGVYGTFERGKTKTPIR